MLLRRPALLIAALAVWSLTAAVATAQTTLRYKFKEGESFKYAVDQKMKMSMDIMGNVIDMKMDQTSEMFWSIQSVDKDGTAKITVKFGRNKMNMDSPMGKIEVDSDKAQEPEDQLGQVLYRVVKGLADMEFSGSITATGEYSDLKIPEKTVKAFQNIPGGEAFSEMFSADGIKRMLSQSGLIMPKEAITAGKTWKHKADMKLPIGKMVSEIEYTYGGPVQKDGRSLEKITLKPKASIEADPAAPVAMKLKSHKGTGTALFDNVAGRLLEVVNEQTLNLEAEIMGMTFNQNMVQTVTMRLVEKK